MKGYWKHIAASTSITAVFIICALALSVSAVPMRAPAVEAAAPEFRGASVASSFKLIVQAVDGAGVAVAADGIPQPAARNVAQPAAQPAPATAAPVQAEPPATAPDESAAPAKQDPEDAPSAGAVDPDLPAPTGLKADFYYSGTRRVELSWQGVQHPDFLGYGVLRWSEGDFDTMLAICQQLAVIDPSLQGLVDELGAQFSLLLQDGWTYTERNDILADTGSALDPLLAALVSTPGAEDLAVQMVELADLYETAANNYTDSRFSNNTYYLYVVAALFSGGDTSLPSNCEGIFSVRRRRGPPPSPPAGFSALAYDPGVALEWDRNTEVDLAGYDVYVMEGGNEVKLNDELITRGTEFFHMTGLADVQYRVYALDIEGRCRNPARATSALAPATIYGVDDLAWQYSGQWAREDYSALETDGRVLRVTMGQGNRATLTFTGRRVRVFSARFWSCGDVRFYIDGSPVSTFGLYYDGGYANPPDPYIPALWQQRAFQVTGLCEGQHTLVIEAVGSGGEQGQNFINFDYAEVR